MRTAHLRTTGSATTSRSAGRESDHQASDFVGRLPPPPTTRVWSRPRRLGYPEMLRISGGIVAPLLAGFSLATITLLVTSDSRPRLSEWAVVAFVAAVGFLLF